MKKKLEKNDYQPSEDERSQLDKYIQLAMLFDMKTQYVELKALSDDLARLLP